MGLFGIFSRKKKTVQDDSGREKIIEEEAIAPSPEKKNKDAKRPVRLNSHTERMGYIKENCEIIQESNRQTSEAKVEYQAVTSYLTDMQRITMIPPEQRENLEEAARKIINLSKERSRLQHKSPLLSDRQYHLYEGFETQIPKDLKVLRENEEYQIVIQQDIRHLEQERMALNEEQEEIISKQSFLKGIAVTTSVIVIILFFLFAVLSSYSKANFSIPFLMTVLMGMVSAFYIFMEARKNSGNVRLVQMKQNRQIMLMNKVKIKSVNNLNYLDYTYNKYMVENYAQLKTAWEEYVRMKDEARRYQSNTELLEFFHNELVHELKNFGVVDSEIWIYQPTAILDPKEMVEVRHRLNVRRQKLRERIETNDKQKEEALAAIQQTMKVYPDSREEAEKLLRRYQIAANI
jgi:uncharacterized membrane protein (DUF485 family)